MNVCDPQLRHFAVARQRAPIWLQRYEKTIKPAPFSVVIDVFSVSYQRPHYSSLIAQRHEFSPSVVANTLRMLMVSDKRTYLSLANTLMKLMYFYITKDDTTELMVILNLFQDLSAENDKKRLTVRC